MHKGLTSLPCCRGRTGVALSALRISGHKKERSKLVINDAELHEKIENLRKEIELLQMRVRALEWDQVIDEEGK